jgi:hypothetical protein
VKDTIRGAWVRPLLTERPICSAGSGDARCYVNVGQKANLTASNRCLLRSSVKQVNNLTLALHQRRILVEQVELKGGW